MKKICWFASLFIVLGVWGQNGEVFMQETFTNKDSSEYTFTTVANLERTSVKNQFRTGTCWSFSALSFFESELIRLGHMEVDLSQMFVVYHTYVEKGDKYVRTDGKLNFGQGGAFHDIPFILRKYGIAPLASYQGFNYDGSGHNHSEMQAILKGMLDAVNAKPQKGSLVTRDGQDLVWKEAYSAVLDAYLGAVPDTFTVDGKLYTPKTYRDALGLNMDEYVSLTSFTNHEFYKECKLAIPDNWVWDNSYNVPLNDLFEATKNALMNGYTLAWGADVSEKGFSPRDALAIVPADESTIQEKGKDSKFFNDAGATKVSNAFLVPTEEKEITQELRQLEYDNKMTTDDHGMHIVGLAKDQNGKEYFIIKNSWGTEYNQCDGYILVSEAYFKLKTINVYLNVNGLTKDLKNKIIKG